MYVHEKPDSGQVAQESDKPQTALEHEEVQKWDTTRIFDLEKVRNKSCLDGPNKNSCVGTQGRNRCMFIAIAAVFFVLPVLMLFLAFTAQLSSTTEELETTTAIDTTAATSTDNTLRML